MLIRMRRVLLTIPLALMLATSAAAQGPPTGPGPNPKIGRKP